MKILQPYLVCCLGLAALSFAIIPQAAADDADALFDPAKLEKHADYQIQGEYLGTLQTDEGDVQVGLQVIALGNHEFQATAYPGGLPGQGWERGDEKFAAKGTTRDGVTKLQGDHGYAIIQGERATIFGNDGNKMGELKKTLRKSKTLGKAPPENATVLFDGTSADQFENGKLVLNNLLMANCTSKTKLGDHQLHLEFRTPFKPTARGQARGNSGVYLQGRYECQVLDSFGLEGENNECGGIYSIGKPKVNACFPPMTWQTYDIDFTAARYDDAGKKTSNARVTIRHNGILIHDDLALPHHTPGKFPEAPEPQSLYLQGHGNPVVYRNIWVVNKSSANN